MSIKENNKPGVRVGQLTSYDPDVDPMHPQSPHYGLNNSFIGGVIYQLEPLGLTSNNSLSLFKLDPLGNLYVLDKLDREKQDHYEFLVIAIDPSDISLSSSAKIFVKVNSLLLVISCKLYDKRTSAYHLFIFI